MPMIFSVNKWHILFLFPFLLGMASCGDDDDDQGEITLNISTTINGVPFSLQERYLSPEGYGLEFSEFKFYLSDLVVVDSEGNEEALTDVLLHDYRQPESYNYRLPVGDYERIQFGLGLNETQNHGDETTYAVEHPLSYAQNMHWGWAALYKFVIMEGRTDVNPDTEFYENGMAYHTGLDSLYRVITLDRTIEVLSDQTEELTININLDKLFANDVSTLDVIAEPNSHTTGADFPLALKFTNQLIQTFE